MCKTCPFEGLQYFRHPSAAEIEEAYWRWVVTSEGDTFDGLDGGMITGECSDGSTVEWTVAEEIEHIEAQGMWGYYDEDAAAIHYWIAADVTDIGALVHFFAHELGHRLFHVVGTAPEHEDPGLAEELRCEDIGHIAALAYELAVKALQEPCVPPSA